MTFWASYDYWNRSQPANRITASGWVRERRELREWARPFKSLPSFEASVWTEAVALARRLYEEETGLPWWTYRFFDGYEAAPSLSERPVPLRLLEDLGIKP